MGQHKTPAKPDTGSAQREVLIQERTVLVEEDVAFSRGESSFESAAESLSQSNTEVTGALPPARDPPVQVTQRRPPGDLSSAQLRMLENLERLTHSLQGPEQSLDKHSYARPFPIARANGSKQT
jgi:hypothetical protein